MEGSSPSVKNMCPSGVTDFTVGIQSKLSGLIATGKGNASKLTTDQITENAFQHQVQKEPLIPVRGLTCTDY